MNIRYLTVNNRRFKIERYRSVLSDEFIYSVYKFERYPNINFDPYKWICQCSLNTLIETLRNYE
jgi:hypothetical protein